MDFRFSEDQLLLQSTLRDFLRAECTPTWLRAQWQTETGRSPSFWTRLAEMGVPALLVPEDQGGLGMNETDLALLMEEVGRVGLAEPVTGTAVGAALLGAILKLPPLKRVLATEQVKSRYLEAVARRYS